MDRYFHRRLIRQILQHLGFYTDPYKHYWAHTTEVRMNLFEFSSLVGFAVVIALLVRIERVLKTVLSMETIYRERQSLEATVRDFMPTLWIDHEFRENIVSWFALATGPDEIGRAHV